MFGDDKLSKRYKGKLQMNVHPRKIQVLVYTKSANLRTQDDPQGSRVRRHSISHPGRGTGLSAASAKSLQGKLLLSGWFLRSETGRRGSEGKRPKGQRSPGRSWQEVSSFLPK